MEVPAGWEPIKAGLLPFSTDPGRALDTGQPRARRSVEAPAPPPSGRTLRSQGSRPDSPGRGPSLGPVPFESFPGGLRSSAAEGLDFQAGPRLQPPKRIGRELLSCV